MANFYFFFSGSLSEPEEDPGILENIEVAIGEFCHNISLLFAQIGY